LLRHGVLLSGAFVAGGLLAALVANDGTVFATTAGLLRGVPLPESAPTPWELWTAPGGLVSPEGWITVGIALLVALPVLRVGWLCTVFARNGERALATSALVVLTMLVLGFFFGAAH
jgi:uncharacterized membrane protein